MARLLGPTPLRLDCPDLVVGIREALDCAGFEETRIGYFLGCPYPRALSAGAGALARLRSRVAGDDPLGIFIELFLLGASVEADRARAAMAPTSLEDWARVGLVSRDGSRVRGRLALATYRGITIAHDASWDGGEVAADFVIGLSQTTMWLHDLTARFASSSTLDLGTGCGFQAIRARSHSRRVVATDRGPRALNVARFNAQLNPSAPIEILEGDRFAPVADQRFDLVISNPPFVISPERDVIFRDGGFEADGFCERIAPRRPRG